MRISLRRYLTAPFWILPLAGALIVLALPLFGAAPAVLRIIVSICLLALLVLGLNVTFGYSGELALGQSALYAIGAYTAAYLAIQQFDLSLTFVVALLAAGVVGLLTGIPGLRLGSWSMAMVTFFLVLLVPDVVTLLTEQLGGPSGLSGIPLPVLFGARLSASGYFTLVVIVTIVFFAAIRNFIVSPHGHAVRVMHESPVLARSLGFSVTRLKLTAYLIGAFPAGAAGALFAYQDGYISPTSFGLSMAIVILAGSIIGGSASIYGAIIGAVIMVIGPLRATGVQQFSLIIFGLLLLLGALFFSGGIAQLCRNLVRRYLVRDEVLPDAAAAVPSDELISRLRGESLEVEHLVKRFGGNTALDDVSMTFEAGTVTGLIGPNGSGKTTLLNIVSGFYRPTSGAIRLGGQDLASLHPHQVARRGVARTFQTPVIPKGLTAAETVAIAMQSAHGVSMAASVLRLPGYRKTLRRHRREALELLALLDIAHLADVDAAALPLGTRRLLEVARALAADAKLILLDEPASGLDESEVEELANLIRKLRASGATIVLVEHNFEMVMSVADHVYVLDTGRIVSSGTAGHVRNDPRVTEVYLGAALTKEQ
ncbi:branched-chain amino acid ABC transporter ATP-binding protein/permease [Agromyces aerolatus]|uniref:branched-chain amino acid ABC transporter ATP-binding protein/permease n=1 Tax=Agromyces sp. LY-1074 TaxID=3074080 RepID=UPI0028597A24|nr:MULTISPECIES: branched-chain amino acid ABC transporter ATP-binding protein/permease [unclassified Agromyces]MDR5699434.1 branched-chain amino acid ABC transporter ATP-binding protein/permease [Agromyces sp. LY-1074]MDR5705730.1 branched-chain amino acid ABC transporter ATP-binding protein/permease [Agromyces sp. LY-1358]